MTGFTRWQPGFIRPADKASLPADEASPPADKASPPAKKASEFVPYIFRKLAPSFSLSPALRAVRGPILKNIRKIIKI